MHFFQASLLVLYFAHFSAVPLLVEPDELEEPDELLEGADPAA